jgi:hypothetical protein
VKWGTALGIVFTTMMLTTAELAGLSAVVDKKNTLGACAGGAARGGNRAYPMRRFSRVSFGDNLRQT